MSQPNPATAIVLNNILSRIQIAEDELNFQDANVEFALGVPQAIREIDLCWGFAPVSAKNHNDMFAHLIVSPGLIRYNGILCNPFSSQTAFTFDTNDFGSQIINKAYAFGSVYINVYSPSPNTGSLLYNFVKKNSVSVPLLVSQDYDIDTAKELFANNEITPTPPDNNDPNLKTFELFRFVVDIQHFDPNDDVSRNVITVHPIDLRKIRGFGGFAEEVMATTLTPSLVLSKRNNHVYIQKIKDDFKELVKSWVLLTAWSPNFIEYWQANTSMMPANLKTYLSQELGVVI